MKRLKISRLFTGVQLAVLAFIALSGIFFFLNGKPYRQEYSRPEELGFLEKGDYTLVATYENSPPDNYIVVYSDEAVDRRNRPGVVFARQEIPEGSGVVSFPLSIGEAVYGVRIGTALGGGVTELTIQSKRIIHKDHYVLVFLMLAACVTLGILFVRMRRETGKAGAKLLFGYPEKYMLPLVLVGMGLLASLPLFSDSLLWGDDAEFHLSRLEGIYRGLAAGDFPVRITPQHMAGYGSLTALMYPQAFLYPAAALRFLGVSLMLCYKLLLTAVNVGTAFGAYHGAKNICGSRNAGLWMSGLYTFSLYRLSNMYVRGALGETLAMAFLPLVIWGVYEVLWGKRRWMVLVLGMTGVMQSHVLSVQLCALFMAAELLFWLASKRKNQFGPRLLDGCKAVGVTALLNASFLVPFLYFCKEDFQCFHMPFEVSEHAAYFSQMFALFPSVEGASLAPGTTQHEMPIAVGGALAAGAVLFVLAYGKKGKRRSKKVGAGLHCLVYGGAAVLMASWIFPWERVAQAEALRQFFTSLQFSWRFLAPATVFWSLTAAVGITGLWEGKGAFAASGGGFPAAGEGGPWDDEMQDNGMSLRLKQERAIGGWAWWGMALLTLISTVYFFDGLAQNRYQRADKMALEGLSHGDAMYLYRDGDEFRTINLDYHREEAYVKSAKGTAAEYYDYKKNGSRIDVEVVPLGEGEDVLLFPLYWFPGYEILINGEKAPVFAMDTLVACDMPSESAKIQVRYRGFWFFAAADAVTALTLGSIAGWEIYKRKKIYTADRQNLR